MAMNSVKIAYSCILASLCGLSASGDVIQNFDQVAAGPLTAGGWAVSGGGAQVVAGATPNGSQYLQLLDSAANAASYATYTLPSAVDTSGGSVQISFLLRRESGGTANANNADFVIFAKNTSSTVVQAGIKSNGVFYYVTGGSVTNNIQTISPAADGLWYRFDILYSVNSNSMTSSYTLTITDTSTNTQLISLADLAGRTLTDSSYFNIYAVQLKTTSSGVGNVDVDAISIAPVPEPASLGLAAAGFAGLLLRRRKNRN